MVSRSEKVREFHEAFNVERGVDLAELDREAMNELLQFRFNLIFEEIDEFAIAHGKLDRTLNPDMEDNFLIKDIKVEMLDALADIAYLIEGTADILGMDLETAFSRVHESNMSKLGKDGKPIYREDGKVLKGENFKEPMLNDLI